MMQVKKKLTLIPLSTYPLSYAAVQAECTHTQAVYTYTGSDSVHTIQAVAYFLCIY